MSDIVDLNFRPTRPQLKAKHKFWKAIEDNPLIGEVASLPNSEIARLAGTPSVIKWAKEDEQFKQWFADKDSLKVMIRVGAEAAVDRLVKIVSDDRVGPKEAVTASAQVQAAKLLLDFAGLAPAQQKEVKITSGQLPDNEKELRDYIEAGVKKLQLAEK